MNIWLTDDEIRLRRMRMTGKEIEIEKTSPPKTYQEILKKAHKLGQIEKWEMDESLRNSKYNDHKREDRYNF